MFFSFEQARIMILPPLSVNIGPHGVPDGIHLFFHAFFEKQQGCQN